MICRWKFWVLLGILVLPRPALGAEPKRLRILTSLAPIYSWTTSIVGDRADVDNLLPADVGPHDFQFRPPDLKKVQAADLIVINGLGIESWLEKTFKNAGSDRTDRVVRTTDGLQTDFIYHLPELALDPPTRGTDKTAAHEHHHDAPNPHLWLDPLYARHGVSNILSALCRRDPTNAEVYRKNAALYCDQLTQLDQDIRAVTSRLSQKSIITFHDSFPYFCRRYDLEIAGVVEEIPSVTPSPKYLSALARVIKARKIQIIFTEPQFEPRLVRQLSRDLSIQFTELDVLETGVLKPDFYTLGMRRNLQTLAAALK